MSSLPNPNPNPNPNLNPNSNLPPINQPSTSTKPNKPKKKKRNKRKNKNKNKKKYPNWLDLPEEIWFLILSKLRTIYIIENVQKVCTLFRKICKQPSMFKVIDMQLPTGYAFMSLPYNLNAMTRHVVDRSDGGLVDIYLEFVCDDETLAYIVERSKNLKHLRLGHYLYVSDEGLIEAVKSLPVLEELQIIICDFSHETYETIGQLCPSLRSFSLNGVGSRAQSYIYNEDALAIARSMPNLRRLQLIGNSMTNEGLKAILDGCPLLESLDLRACFHIDLSGALGKRCDKIKELRRPFDSTAGYTHQACTDDDKVPYQSRDQDSVYDSDDWDDLGFDPRFENFLNGIPDYLDMDDFSDMFYYGYYDTGFPRF